MYMRATWCCFTKRMTGSHFCKCSGIVCYLILVYFCFLFPFTTEYEFHTSKHFLHLFTIGSILLLITSTVGNLFIIVVVQFGFNHRRPFDVFLICIAIADGIITLLQYPLWIALSWASRNGENVEPLESVMKYMDSAKYGGIAFSTMCVAIVFMFRLYTCVRKESNIHVMQKYVSICVALFIWLLVALVMFYNGTEEWSHDLFSVIALYLPFIVTVICIVISKRLGQYWEGFANGQINMYYVMFSSCVFYWTPLTIVQMLHRYCCELHPERMRRIWFYNINLIHLKCCTNIFILLLFDGRFRQIACHMLSRWFPCLKKQEAIHFELEDFSIRYSANKNDSVVVEDLTADNDEQTLIDSLEDAQVEFSEIPLSD